jgi:hypothetical protein
VCVVAPDEPQSVNMKVETVIIRRLFQKSGVGT